MKLINKTVPGAGIHRTGWPVVNNYFRQKSSDDGILFHDFVEVMFRYSTKKSPIHDPWAGIFHSPATVDSSLLCDKNSVLSTLPYSPNWTFPVKAITLCEEAAEFIKNNWNIECLSLKHPIERNFPRWKGSGCKQIVQIGSTLRDSRAIYELEVEKGWEKFHLQNKASWSTKRDELLNIPQGTIKTFQHVSNEIYDSILSTSVIISKYFGVGASNLIVECMIRGTPILINKLPPIVEYLGEDYPFYMDNPDFSELNLKRTSQYLLDRASILPTPEVFVDKVLEFLEQ